MLPYWRNDLCYPNRDLRYPNGGLRCPNEEALDTEGREIQNGEGSLHNTRRKYLIVGLERDRISCNKRLLYIAIRRDLYIIQKSPSCNSFHALIIIHIHPNCWSYSALYVALHLQFKNTLICWK